MIISEHTPTPGPATPIEKWADQTVKHLAHHFRLSQTIVREYSRFIFSSKAFTPQQIMDALGPAGAEVMTLLESHAGMISGMLAKSITAVPDGWTWKDVGGGHVQLIQLTQLPQAQTPPQTATSPAASTEAAMGDRTSPDATMAAGANPVTPPA